MVRASACRAVTAQWGCMGLWGCWVKVGVINKKLVNRAISEHNEENRPRGYVVVVCYFDFLGQPTVDIIALLVLLIIESYYATSICLLLFFLFVFSSFLVLFSSNYKRSRELRELFSF